MAPMTNELQQVNAHVLCIPYHDQAHVATMLLLAKVMARKGITVSFVAFEYMIARIMHHDKSELQKLDIQFIGLQNPEVVASHPDEAAPILERAFKPVLGKITNDRISGVSVPTSILADPFIFWIQEVADRLHIPWYLLYSGALNARCMQGITELFAQGQLEILEPDDKLARFEGSVSIPGLPPLRYHEFSRGFRNKPSAPLGLARKTWQAAGVVAHSFDELEEEPIKAWRGPDHPGYQQKKVPKLYVVGPLFMLERGALPNMAGAQGSTKSVERSLRWLDSQPPSSVLYVAFGSRKLLSPRNIRALELGVASSNHHFLWVPPQPRVEEDSEEAIDVLPSSFQAAVDDRGCLCMGWAPQLQILAHRSIGGFLTHGGWNSFLESIAMGVPMISYPQSADQHLNTRYFMDELKIVHQVRAGPEDNMLEQHEVERAVRLVMEEPQGLELRKRVQVFKSKAAAAVAEGGSHSRAIEELIRDLSKH